MIVGGDVRDRFTGYLDSGYHESESVIVSIDNTNTFIFRHIDQPHPYKQICLDLCTNEEMNELLADLIILGWYVD